jgi:hypothetical protein
MLVYCFRAILLQVPGQGLAWLGPRWSQVWVGPGQYPGHSLGQPPARVTKSQPDVLMIQYEHHVQLFCVFRFSDRAVHFDDLRHTSTVGNIIQGTVRSENRKRTVCHSVRTQFVHNWQVLRSIRFFLTESYVLDCCAQSNVVVNLLKCTVRSENRKP